MEPRCDCKGAKEMPITVVLINSKPIIRYLTRRERCNLAKPKIDG